MAHPYLDPNALARIGGMEFVARLVVEGFITGLHKSPYQGFNVEFSEHRQYMPGDDIRHVDWRVYGKSDRFYVKKFEEETNLRAHLLLDTSRSMAYRHERLSKLEYACYLSATLAYLMLRQRDSVGLVTVDDRVRQYVPPRGHATHLNALLHVLETVEPGDDTNLSQAFDELSRRLVRRGVIVVLSDLLDDPDGVLKALRLFRHMKHEVVVFHILDEAELRLPFRGPLVFRDIESGHTLPAYPDVLRRAYREAVDMFVEEYRKGCTAHSVDYVLMDTATPFDKALTAYLSRRK
jgi:uncharacterized protein (DUF58 family)